MRIQRVRRLAVSSFKTSSLGWSRFLLGTATTIFAFAILAISTATARADGNAVRAVRLSNVVGTVQIFSGSDPQFTQAYPNMPLMQDSKVQTGEDGRAEIQFEDGSVVRLTPNSSAQLSVLSRTSEGNTDTRVDLLTGLSYVEMSGTANQRFVVNFAGNEVISPTPAKFRVNLDSNPVQFAVIDGSAHVSNGNAFAVDVKMGESIRFDAADPTRYFLAQGIDPDSWDQWNADRDQALAQMAALETHEARNNGNPNDAAWSDLDYYGNWYAASDGSQFWVPDGAGAGWDPYGLGYWGYYGGIGGYTWISGYPWGWYPYHCGTWRVASSLALSSGTTWGWFPINCGHGWYPYAGVGSARYRLREPKGHIPVHGPVIIKVDRGIEVTKLTPHLGPAPKSIAGDGGPARLLPKASNPHNIFVSRAPAPAPGRPTYSSAGGQQLGSIPVYRPATPAPVYRTSSSFASGGGAYAPHYSAPSVASAPSAHASAPAPSGGGSSGGGGHVK
jgi:hypothetical protein